MIPRHILSKIQRIRWYTQKSEKARSKIFICKFRKLIYFQMDSILSINQMNYEQQTCRNKWRIKIYPLPIIILLTNIDHTFSQQIHNIFIHLSNQRGRKERIS